MAIAKGHQQDQQETDLCVQLMPIVLKQKRAEMEYVYLDVLKQGLEEEIEDNLKFKLWLK